MADNIRVVSTARVSALEGIRAAISDIAKSAQRVLESSVEARPMDEVTLSPEAQGKPPKGSELTKALRDMEMSRYRAAASAEVARAADERVAIVTSQLNR